MDEATKAELEAEQHRKWGRLTVYAVGSAVVGLNEGDEVMIDPGSVSRVLRIPLSEDRTVLLIGYHDIAHIW